jgi:hypothetical protein
MRVIQVRFDTVMITLLMDRLDLNEIVKLINSESRFGLYVENDKILMKWNENNIEECYIEDVTDQRGIIQFEQH